MERRDRCTKQLNKKKGEKDTKRQRSGAVPETQKQEEKLERGRVTKQHKECQERGNRHTNRDRSREEAHTTAERSKNGKKDIK